MNPARPRIFYCKLVNEKANRGDAEKESLFFHFWICGIVLLYPGGWEQIKSEEMAITIDNKITESYRMIPCERLYQSNIPYGNQRTSSSCRSLNDI